jgi:hypothetical protein
MKSSLKTFLKGKNPVCGVRLKGALFLREATTPKVNSSQYQANEGDFFHIDVLDDGTAITYCPHK